MTNSGARLLDPRGIDDLLNYRLWQLVSTISHRTIRLLEGQLGVTRREWRLIAVLATAGDLSPSTLAEAAQLDRGRVSKGITSLTQKGLVERRPLPNDRRRARVALTEIGRHLYEQAFPKIAQMNAEVVRVLPASTAVVFEEALRQMLSRALELDASELTPVRTVRRLGGRRHPQLSEES